MRFFHTIIPAFVAALSLGVTGQLTLTENQVYEGIEHLLYTTAQLQSMGFEIPNDDYATMSEVGVYPAAASCRAKTHSLHSSSLGTRYEEFEIAIACQVELRDSE